MAAKWIEVITGSLEQKKQYRTDKARIEGLPQPYATAATAMHRYLMYASGVTDGESWSEGDPKNAEYLGKVAPGRYVMRFDTQWGNAAGAGYGVPPSATMHVSAGKRSIGTWFLALLAIAAPLILGVVRKITFESRRWSNSNVGQD